MNQNTTAITTSSSRPDQRDALPAPGQQHEGRDELGHRRADIADAEDAERRALLAGGIEARDIGDADRKGTAGQADTKRRDQHLRVGGREGEQEGRDRRRQHRRRVDEPAAKPVGPDAEQHAHQRAGQDRHADQQAELGLAQAEFGFDLDADDGKDRPHREADGEGDRGHGQRPGRAASGRGLVKWALLILRSMCGVGGAALWLKTKKPPARLSRPYIRDRAST